MKIIQDNAWCITATETKRKLQTLSYDISLTHLSLASYKCDTGKKCRLRSDAAVAAFEQGLHCFY